MDLNKINSMTKYPSILTYHKLGEKGRLLDEVQVEFDCPVIVTEKIDGVNARIILFPDGFYIIGSREELLYGKGDLIGNPQLGIVDELKPVAEALVPSDNLRVYYFEVYGGNVTKGSKQYTSEKKVGHLLFDVVEIDPYKFKELCDLPIEQISAWRENGGQDFLSDEELRNTLLDVPVEVLFELTPRIGFDQKILLDLPISLNNTYDWLNRMLSEGTFAKLDAGGVGRAEGVVVRTPDRSKIAKIRFEDYERTLRWMKG